MKNLRAMGYGLTGLFLCALTGDLPGKALALFAGRTIEPGSFTEEALWAFLLFSAGFIACVCFALAHGGTNTGQKILLAPGLYMCVCVLSLFPILSSGIGRPLGWGRDLMVMLLRSGGLFFLPSFAGVLAGVLYLRLHGDDGQLPQRLASLRRRLAAVGTGGLCSVIALVAVVIPSTVGTSTLLFLESYAVLSMGLLYFVGGFFALGVVSHRMFAQRYGADASFGERIVLSPGLYAFVILFLPAFESESGDPGARNIIFLMVFLLVLAVSFAGVQYSSRRMKRVKAQNKGNGVLAE
jgi:uncharacterized membrane protein YhaH (DUF805 family)